MRVEQLDQLGEVSKRPRQPVDLVDDDHVNPAGPNILQQLLERRPLHRTSRKAAVVIAFANELPSEASRWLSRELKSCSRPESVETRV